MKTCAYFLCWVCASGILADTMSQQQMVLIDFENGYTINKIVTNSAQVSLVPHWNNFPGDTALRISFSQQIQMPSITFTSPFRLDLSGYVFMAMDVHNVGKDRVQISAFLNGMLRADGMVVLDPGEVDTLAIILNRKWDDLPAYIRNYFWPEFAGLPGGFLTGYSPDPKAISILTVCIQSPKNNATVEIDNIRADRKYTLPPEDSLKTFHPFIDTFGQFKHGEWPGKTHSAGDLAAQYNQELADLQKNPGPQRWNKYGGWDADPQLAATGNFRVQKYKGKWWLVDPDGRLFWSNGIDCIGKGGYTLLKTPTADRSHYFEKLPEVIDGTGWVYGYFFCSNLIKKYGSDWANSATKTAHTRLRSWGINTIGAWSDYSVYFTSPQKTPYVVIIHSRIGPGIYPDSVTPEKMKLFEEDLRKQFGYQTRTTGKDPWCIGYFVDNETWWATWAFDSLSFANAANEYYRICRSVVKDSIPGKLYMGNRKHYFTPDYIPVQELYGAAKYCDVISINRYSFTMRDFPLLGMNDSLLDKPVIIGEFHFGALDRGLPHTGLRCVKNQNQRAEAYIQYMQDALEHTNIIGAHWFQYEDEPYTTRGDAENCQVGFVDICDRPYPELINACRAINYHLYEYRLTGVTPIETLSGPALQSSLPVKLSVARAFHSIVFTITTKYRGTLAVEVFNLLGRKVGNMQTAPLAPGTHAIAWNFHAAPGIYIVQVRSGNYAPARQFHTVQSVR